MALYGVLVAIHEEVTVTYQGANSGLSAFNSFASTGPKRTTQLMTNPVAAMWLKNAIDVNAPLQYPKADGTIWTLQPSGSSNRFNTTSLIPADDQSVYVDYVVSRSDFPNPTTTAQSGILTADSPALFKLPSSNS